MSPSPLHRYISIYLLSFSCNVFGWSTNLPTPLVYIMLKKHILAHLFFSHINLMKERKPVLEEPSPSTVLSPVMWCCYNNTHFPPSSLGCILVHEQKLLIPLYTSLPLKLTSLPHSLPFQL